ncbi:hypothetical protein [Paraburkholderia sp. GAS32]|uniref:hypothetical protein n=1 Tax=Paraburkholderia sp. GAS32 TaxID=3035129 RepID=UPI003D1D6D55
MIATTKAQYAARGFELSDRKREGHWTVQYLRGHRQWVKIIRETDKRRWYVARGYEGVTTAHDTAYHSFDLWRWTWSDALEHAAQQIETWK